MKKEKACMPLFNCYFSFWDLFKGFSLISRPFWTVGKFLPSWSEAEQVINPDKKIFLLINLVPKIPCFYIWTKFRLKNPVTTVHLVHFFIHVFEGEISCKLKNSHLGKPPLKLKKAFLICLHLSTLVHIVLHSPTFV